MRSDIEIAQAADIKPIAEIADLLGIPEQALEPYGRTKAKVDLGWLHEMMTKCKRESIFIRRGAVPIGSFAMPRLTCQQ